jgi:uncharacterized membrane protein YidH (DUF202 family)
LRHCVKRTLITSSLCTGPVAAASMSDNNYVATAMSVPHTQDLSTRPYLGVVLHHVKFLSEGAQLLLVLAVSLHHLLNQLVGLAQVVGILALEQLGQELHQSMRNHQSSEKTKTRYLGLALVLLQRRLSLRCRF